MIVVIDYGMGNLKSIENALLYLGIPFKISKDKGDLSKASAILLPGVGAFADGMKNLNEKGLDTCIKEEVLKGKPLLGICLGMQMLFNRSFEGGETTGLGLIDGDIVKLDPKIKVKIPHIGWNRLDKVNDDIVISNVKGNSFVYYVHSYGAQNVNKEDVLCTSEYGELEIPGLVRKGKVYGAQFHPEKSGNTGLEIIKSFWEMI